MSKALQVYLLNPAELSPETIAVTFAKTSRSPLSFREIAQELTEEKSADFTEKWVVGYGHASVAEHAILHIAVENISRLAIEEIEGNRLASFTEKSTRYQKWGVDSYLTPREIEKTEMAESYISTCQHLFKTYQDSLSVIGKLVRAENPQEENESVKAWENRIRTKYIDVCRYLLPAAALANVGITINARALEHALQKMLSHPLLEVQTLGQRIKATAIKEIPTLVKYADSVPYLQQVREQLQEISLSKISDSESTELEDCHLVSYDREGEERVMAAALFRYSNLPYTICQQKIHNASTDEKDFIARKLMGDLGNHDIPLRELEHCVFTFEIILDQGAYFELKRHRMMTISTQPLEAALGYEIPVLMIRSGFEQTYRDAMSKARETFNQLHDQFPAVASYVIPNGYKRRVLITLNLRSLDHLIQLRTSPNAHFAMRRVAQKMAAQIRKVCPIFSQYLRAYPAETWQEIENLHFIHPKY